MGFQEDRWSHQLSLSLLTGSWLAVLGVLGAGPGFGVAAQEAPSVQLPPAEAEARVGFTRLTSVRELPDGRVLLVDQGENRLRVLDWSSGSVEDIGREGEGPGEYLRVGWLYPMSESTTLLTDQFSHRWYLLEGADIDRTLAATNPVVNLVKDEVQRLFGTADGHRFLTAEGYHWDPSLTRRRYYNPDSLVALVVEADVELEHVVGVDTVAVLKGRSLEGDGCTLGMGSADRTRTCSLLASEDVPLLFEDGWLAVARVRPYRVDWLTPEGEWVLGAPLETGDGPPLDRQERCWVMQGNPPAGPEDCAEDTRVDSWGWPQAMPAFLPRVTSQPGADVPVVLATPGGSLLIRRAPRLSQPGARYDLVDRTGTRTATFLLPPREAIVGFGENVVYTLRMDDVDLQWLRRHPWSMG